MNLFKSSYKKYSYFFQFVNKTLNDKNIIITFLFKFLSFFWFYMLFCYFACISSFKSKSNLYSLCEINIMRGFQL